MFVNAAAGFYIFLRISRHCPEKLGAHIPLLQQFPYRHAGIRTGASCALLPFSRDMGTISGRTAASSAAAPAALLSSVPFPVWTLSRNRISPGIISPAGAFPGIVSPSRRLPPGIISWAGFSRGIISRTGSCPWAPSASSPASMSAAGQGRPWGWARHDRYHHRAPRGMQISSPIWRL